MTPAKLGRDVLMRRVAKSFPGAKAEEPLVVIDDLSLHVEAGQSIAILGPSGCGKTTLLRLIAGLDEPSNAEAEILVDGEAVHGPGPGRGLMFQQYSSFPWLTAQANVRLAIRQTGVAEPEATELARSYLALVGLEGHRQSYPRQLSGGQQQRLALARTLAAKPAVMLLDEPYGALDAQTREAMQTQLLQMWQDLRPTIIFVTHDIREAIRVGERVIVLSRAPARIIHAQSSLPAAVRVALCETPRANGGTSVDRLEWASAAYALEHELRTALTGA